MTVSHRICTPPPATREGSHGPDDGELACWSTALRAPPVRVRSDLGLRTFSNRWGTALLAESDDHPFLNRVFLRPRDAALHGSISNETDPDLAELLAIHRDAGVRRFFVHVEEADEAGFAPSLRRAGLVRYPRSWVKLRRTEIADTPTPDTAAETAPAIADDVAFGVISTRDAPRFAALFRQGFGFSAALDPVFETLVGSPSFQALGAFSNGELVSAGLLFTVGTTAYLAGGVTDPTHRRRGLQGALVGWRVRLAHELGCHVVASETGEEKPGEPQVSFRNLQRAGLLRVRIRHNYVLPGSRW